MWWGALRGAIGLALALVVYSEQFRYEFTVSDGGSGYVAATTSAFVVDKSQASLLGGGQNVNLYQGTSMAHAEVEVRQGKVVGISQSSKGVPSKALEIRQFSGCGQAPRARLPVAKRL